MGDFHELKLEFRSAWRPVLSAAAAAKHVEIPSHGSNNSTPKRGVSSSSHYSAPVSPMLNASSSLASSLDFSAGDVLSPGPRFCHIGVVYESAFYIFGGYDGAQRYMFEKYLLRV